MIQRNSVERLRLHLNILQFYNLSLIFDRGGLLRQGRRLGRGLRVAKNPPQYNPHHVWCWLRQLLGLKLSLLITSEDLLTPAQIEAQKKLPPKNQEAERNSPAQREAQKEKAQKNHQPQQLHLIRVNYLRASEKIKGHCRAAVGPLVAHILYMGHEITSTQLPEQFTSSWVVVYGANNPKYLKLPTRVCLTSALTVLSPITSTGKVIRKSNRNVIALQRLGGVGSGPLLTNPTMVDVMTSRRVASNRFSKTPFSDTRVSPVLPSISNRDHKSCCIQAGIYVTGLVQGKRATHLCYTP